MIKRNNARKGLPAPKGAGKKVTTRGSQNVTVNSKSLTTSPKSLRTTGKSVAKSKAGKEVRRGPKNMGRAQRVVRPLVKTAAKKAAIRLTGASLGVFGGLAAVAIGNSMERTQSFLKGVDRQKAKRAFVNKHSGDISKNSAYSLDLSSISSAKPKTKASAGYKLFTKPKTTAPSKKTATTVKPKTTAPSKKVSKVTAQKKVVSKKASKTKKAVAPKNHITDNYKPFTKKYPKPSKYNVKPPKGTPVKKKPSTASATAKWLLDADWD